MRLKGHILGSKRCLRFWIMVVGTLVSFVLFEEIVDYVFHDSQVEGNEAHSFDLAVSNWASELRSPLLTQSMTDLTALGSARSV